MDRIQYTIRSIPPKLDSLLRQRAQKSGKSLNDVVIETLEKGTGTTQRACYSDLDWFIGNKSFDRDFDEAITWLDSAPRNLQ